MKSLAISRSRRLGLFRRRPNWRTFSESWSSLPRAQLRTGSKDPYPPVSVLSGTLAPGLLNTDTGGQAFAVRTRDVRQSGPDGLRLSQLSRVTFHRSDLD